MFILLSVFSLHTNNKVQWSPLGVNTPKTQQVQEIGFSLGSPSNILDSM